MELCSWRVNEMCLEVLNTSILAVGFQQKKKKILVIGYDGNRGDHLLCTTKHSVHYISSS